MPNSTTSGVPNTKPDVSVAPRAYSPDGVGTLEILCARSLDTLSKNPQTRLASIAWIIARRMASVPKGVKKHTVKEIYTKLCVKATGAGDSDDEEDEAEEEDVVKEDGKQEEEKEEEDEDEDEDGKRKKKQEEEDGEEEEEEEEEKKEKIKKDEEEKEDEEEEDE